MGQRAYPPLKISEIIAILGALGFVEDRQRGSHAHYVRPADPPEPTAECPLPKPRCVVTVDMGYSEINDPRLLKYIVQQSGFSREEFYGATKKGRKKTGA